MMAAMLLKLLEILLSNVRVPFEGGCHYCMVALAVYRPDFGAYFAIAPAKARFSGVPACQ